MRTTLRIAAALAALLATVTIASARFDCGRVARHHYNLPPDPYNRALAWADNLPHTSAAPEMVVVQTRPGRDSAGGPGGHVSRIVRLTGTCSAIVVDEKGSYERDICARLVAYVDPNGGAVHRTSVGSYRASTRSRHAIVAYDRAKGQF